MEENHNLIPHDNPPRQAGKVKIVGILVPVLQVCLIIGIHVVIYSMEELPLKISFCLVGAYMMFSVLLLLVYFVWQKVKGQDICEQGEDCHSNAHLLAGLYIFGIGTLLYSMLQIAGFIECRSHDYEVFHPIATLLFTMFQMLCLQAFIKKAMKYHWLVVIFWYFLIGTNLSSYITNTIVELHLISTIQNNNTVNDTKCNGKVLYGLNTIWKESLISFVSEFNIISSGIIGSIIYKISAISDINVFQEDENNEENKESDDYSLCFRSQPGLVFGIFFCVLIVSSTVCVLYEKDTVLVFYSVSIAALFIMILIFVVMQYCIHNREIKLSVQTDDVLLYISAIGLIAEDFAILVSSGYSFQREEMLALSCCSFFATLFRICATVFQVFILVQYLHLRHRINSTLIKQFLYFILFQNLTAWAIDTFVYLRKDTSFRRMYPTLHYYGTDYEKVASVANVFSIFFHFHSAVLAYEITSTKIG